MFEDNVHPPQHKPNAASTDRRGDRTDFWFTSAARATALVYVSLLVFLSTVFIKADLAVDEFSIGIVMRNLLSAAFWSLRLLIGSCYYSIPIAALVVAAVRGLLRRRRRSIDAATQTNDVAI